MVCVEECKLTIMKRLLELLKEGYLEEDCFGCCGLCEVISQIWFEDKITSSERSYLQTYLNQNEPDSADYVFWFLLKDTASRLNWLDKHIELNSLI